MSLRRDEVVFLRETLGGCGGLRLGAIGWTRWYENLEACTGWLRYELAACELLIPLSFKAGGLADILAIAVRGASDGLGLERWKGGLTAPPIEWRGASD